jgi:hypothetical protein
LSSTSFLFDDELQRWFCVSAGEDDTAVVKTWNVRPSLTWKDGVWGPWTGSGKDEVRELLNTCTLLLHKGSLFVQHSGKSPEKLKKVPSS